MRQHSPISRHVYVRAIAWMSVVLLASIPAFPAFAAHGDERPDLVIETARYIPDAGQFELVIRNAGDAPTTIATGVWFDWLDRNGKLTADDGAVIPILPAGAVYRTVFTRDARLQVGLRSYLFDLYRNRPVLSDRGIDRIRLTIDKPTGSKPNGSVIESDETNNVAMVMPLPPQFELQGLLPQYDPANALKFSVENFGVGTARAPIPVAITWRNADDQAMGVPMTLDIPNDLLASGAGQPSAFAFTSSTFPDIHAAVTNPPADARKIRVTIDPDQTIPQLLDRKKLTGVASLPIVPPPNASRPDLVIDTARYIPDAGEFALIVRNAGDAPTTIATSVWFDWLDRDGASAVGDGVVVPPLAVGAVYEETIQANLLLPIGLPAYLFDLYANRPILNGRGIDRIRLTIDQPTGAQPNGGVIESDETNNTFTVTPLPPQLHIGGVTYEIPGGISMMVSNFGVGIARVPIPVSLEFLDDAGQRMGAPIPAVMGADGVDLHPLGEGDPVTATFTSAAFPDVHAIMVNPPLDARELRITIDPERTVAQLGDRSRLTRTVPVPPIPRSSDATLAALIEDLAGDMNPAFDSAMLTYALAADAAESRVTITPTARDANAQVTVDGEPVARGASVVRDLRDGENDIAVVVTAEDGTTQRTYTLTVTRAAAPLPPPVAPVATPAAFATPEDTVFTGQLAATIADGATATFAVERTTEFGTLAVRADGQFTYTPNADAFGADSFTFTVDDGIARSDPATVAITVESQNDAPTVRFDGGVLAVRAGETVSGTVIANDREGDALTMRVGEPPRSGVVDITAAGVFTYTATPDVVGMVTFTVIANDERADSDPITISVDVAPAPAPALPEPPPAEPPPVPAEPFLSGIRENANTDLTPAFQPNVTAYDLAVDHDVAAITLSLSVGDGTDTRVRVNGTDVNSGSSVVIELASGATTTVDAIVRSTGGGSDRTYTVRIARAAIPPGLVLSRGGGGFIVDTSPSPHGALTSDAPATPVFVNPLTVGSDAPAPAPVPVPSSAVAAPPVIAPIAAVLGTKITSNADNLIASLRPGVRSAKVRDLQRELQRLGFFPTHQSITTYYGPVTQRAVAEYRKSAGSTPKVVALGTKIANIDALIATLRPGMRHARVRELQRELQKLGYFPKTRATTTFYGPVTEQAVERYQRAA